MGFDRARERTGHDDWPLWVPLASAVMPVATAVIAAAQRDAILDPHWTLAVALAAASPWLVDVVSVVIARRTGRTLLMPRAIFAGIVIAATTVLLLEPATIDYAPFFFVLLTAQSAALMSPGPGIAVAVACVAVMLAVEYVGNYDGADIWVFGTLFGYLGGAMVGGQVRATAALREAQDELAGRAAADERRRIAREIHDVVAHSLTVTMLHVTAARLALDDDPDEAREALLEAERLGRQSLDDIRRTVGLLGTGPDGAAPPQPGLSDLPDLAADFAGAGLDVRYEVSGDVTAVPAAAALGIYRVVQESLSNAARHAPGSTVRVSVDVTDGVRVRVRNSAPTRRPRPAPGGGHGLRGMRERAEALGGTLSAGPDGDGWTVVLEVPAAGARPAPLDAARP